MFTRLPTVTRCLLLAHFVLALGAEAQASDPDSIRRAGAAAGRAAAESVRTRKWGMLGFVSGVAAWPIYFVVIDRTHVSLGSVAAAPVGLVVLGSQRARVTIPPSGIAQDAVGEDYHASYERAYVARVKERRLRAAATGAGAGVIAVVVVFAGILTVACAQSC